MTAHIVPSNSKAVSVADNLRHFLIREATECAGAAAIAVTIARVLTNDPKVLLCGKLTSSVDQTGHDGEWLPSGGFLQ
jgi:ABC-type phosphate transport system ATPase subunit